MHVHDPSLYSFETKWKINKNHLIAFSPLDMVLMIIYKVLYSLRKTIKILFQFNFTIESNFEMRAMNFQVF